jgi:glycosyltransferase involved in cell wall biosynthesis
MNQDKPLVSIITPTVPERYEKLVACCIPSINRQTYPNIEHVIVSDGPHPNVTELWQVMGRTGNKWGVYALGRNWRQFSGGASVGAMPRLAGTLLARGSLIAYLDDDDEYLPDHVEKLVKLLTETQSDFVTSQFKRFWSDGRDPDIIPGFISYGHIGTPSVLHRAECLLLRNWSSDGYAEDFALFDAWRKAGLKHANLSEVTVHVHKTV